MSVRKRIDCLIFDLKWRIVLRIQLREACKKLGIKPYKWQRDYALNKSLYLKRGGRSGKTTAIMLWALIRRAKTPVQALMCSHKDPDTTSLSRERWWIDEYMRLALKVGLIEGGTKP